MLQLYPVTFDPRLLYVCGGKVSNTNFCIVVSHPLKGDINDCLILKERGLFGAANLVNTKTLGLLENLRQSSSHSCGQVPRMC